MDKHLQGFVETYYAQPSSAVESLQRAGIEHDNQSHEVAFIVGATESEGGNELHFCSSRFAKQETVNDLGLFEALEIDYRQPPNSEDEAGGEPPILKLPTSMKLPAQAGIVLGRAEVTWNGKIEFNNLMFERFVPVHEDISEDLMWNGGIENMSALMNYASVEEMVHEEAIDLV